MNIYLFNVFVFNGLLIKVKHLCGTHVTHSKWISVPRTRSAGRSESKLHSKARTGSICGSSHR